MESIIKFFTQLNLKKFFFLILTPISMFWTSYDTLCYGLFFLIVIDLISGVNAYCKQNKIRIRLFRANSWENLKSAGLRRTVSKFKDYLFVIVGAWVFESYILKENMNLFDYDLTRIVFVLLSVIELWSIGENFKKSRGYNLFEYLKKLIINRDPKALLEDITKEN